MNLYEFFIQPDLQLPSNWNNHKDFEDFLQDHLNKFLQLIDLLDTSEVSDELQKCKAGIATCCTKLSESVRASFEGHPNEAYQHFDRAMQNIAADINELAFDDIGSKALGILYRVRKSLVGSLQAVDLFHIPFELRHLVATQRYSIPGLPCLYLAGSLYTCWEEMGRPPLHELQCAAFWVKDEKQMKLLNLSNRPARLSLYVPQGKVTTTTSHIKSHIALWPLVFASSIKVKHPSAPFKPEYVIPQMCLQWVTQNHSFDGLVYFSTHVRSLFKNNPLPPCNVVIPAKKVVAAGRCERLCDTFKMTDPYGWQLLSSINVGEGSGGGDVPMYDIDFIEGVTEQYYKTEFGMVQHKLNKLVERTKRRNRNGESTAGEVSPA